MLTLRPCHLSFIMIFTPLLSLFFFFNDTATTEIYTLSLHDALPIYHRNRNFLDTLTNIERRGGLSGPPARIYNVFGGDRKSTRLNSSHGYISYAVFCLKKKKNKK